MFDALTVQQETNKICAALSGRECGIAAFIEEMTELIESCRELPSQVSGYRALSVSAEEMMMIMDFRRDKVERAKKELQEIRGIRESLIISNNNRLNHE